MNKKCQVFTPADYVKELLDSVDYKENLYGKTILENSCGDGNILVEIVQRYIDDCRKQGITTDKIRDGLQRDICGIEIDKEQYEKCINKLNILLIKNEINNVKWNILNEDYLKWNVNTKFQFVVGNPPYITYQELNEEQRKYVRDNFKTCKKGKFDYCYAFIEKSINSLDNDGKMAYLIPSSIFKTVFGASLREYMKEYIQVIKDYTQKKVFDKALVKSAIMILDKANMDNVLHYFDVEINKKIDIPVENLTQKWFFTDENIPGTRKFGEYFQVGHVVATLLNEAYVLKSENYQETTDAFLCNGFSIEKDIVKETATPRSLRYNKEEKIIFPYKYKKGKLIRFSEIEFENSFPEACGYLEEFREQLDDRESDKNALWFEYGRSQALSGLNRRKLLISTIVTDKVTARPLKKECIPYAGMYIVSKKSNKTYTLNDAKQILESAEFMDYVKKVGIHISGSSLRITSKDIENYMF